MKKLIRKVIHLFSLPDRIIWRTMQLEELCTDILERSKDELPELRIRRLEETARVIRKTL